MIYFPVYEMHPPHLLMSSQTQRKNVRNFPSPQPCRSARPPHPCCVQRPEVPGQQQPCGTRQALWEQIPGPESHPRLQPPRPGRVLCLAHPWADCWQAGDGVAFQGPSAEPLGPSGRDQSRGERRRAQAEPGGPWGGVCQLRCAISDKSLNPSVLYAVQLQNRV